MQLKHVKQQATFWTHFNPVCTPAFSSRLFKHLGENAANPQENIRWQRITDMCNERDLLVLLEFVPRFSLHAYSVHPRFRFLSNFPSWLSSPPLPAHPSPAVFPIQTKIHSSSSPHQWAAAAGFLTSFGVSVRLFVLESEYRRCDRLVSRYSRFTDTSMAKKN